MPEAATDTATDIHAGTLRALAAAFGDGVFATVRSGHNLRLFVPAARLVEVLATLKDACGFRFLAELGGTDYLGYPKRTGARFEVHYVLLNLETSERVVVKAGAEETDPKLPSVVSLWPGADWMEREVYDMYGVVFEGHPDLRRILMPDEFTAFPLRKDYPLRGRGERHNFPRITRDQS